MFLKRLTFIATYPWLRLVAFLPFPILYGISSIIAIILFDVFRYRRAVIDENLETAFPELDKDEKRKIRRKFYLHFTDLFIESLKNGLMSNSTFKKRFQVKNVELVERFAKENKSIVILAAHQGNWEWTGAIALYTKVPVYGIYQKINNPYFDRFIHKTRGKSGMHLVPTFKLRDVLEENQKKQHIGMYGLASDQSPMIKKTKHWYTFFEREVPIHTGAEELARTYDMGIVYLSIRKEGRGYYTASFENFQPQVEGSSNYSIMEAYMKKVELEIKEQPHTYLWTHRRFKHAKKSL
jgi:Kdo2-lipid IVA lauroyltransferase/acyltransferase